jgi:hypothetical protein
LGQREGAEETGEGWEGNLVAYPLGDLGEGIVIAHLEGPKKADFPARNVAEEMVDSMGNGLGC